MPAENEFIVVARVPIADDAWLVVEAPADYPARVGSGTVLDAARVMAGALGTIAAKNADYGGAWQAQGWMGNLARIMSKTARLKNMLWRDDPGLRNSDEPVTDTLVDLINLCVFALLNMRRSNRWGQ